VFKFDVTFSDDLQSATVKFPGEIKASTDDLSELIGAFASMRSQMNPPVPDKPPGAGGMIMVCDNPTFWVAPDVIRGGAILRFRHPGLGWVSFWIPHTEAATMIDLLQKFGLAIPPKTEREYDWLAAIEMFYKDYDKIDQDTRALGG
jgi:hypothetical protein